MIASKVYWEIEQKLLVCDRDFAQIEKRKKVTKTFTPENIRDMILNACYKNQFKTLTIKSEEVKIIQRLADEVLNTAKLKIFHVSSLMVNKENPNRETKKSFNDLEEYRTF